jgi:hypothetical protein
MEYLSRFFALLNNIRDGDKIFEEQAFRDVKQVFVALAQKTLRGMTEQEWDRHKKLRMMPF